MRQGRRAASAQRSGSCSERLWWHRCRDLRKWVGGHTQCSERRTRKAQGSEQWVGRAVRGRTDQGWQAFQGLGGLRQTDFCWDFHLTLLLAFPNAHSNASLPDQSSEALPREQWLTYQRLRGSSRADSVPKGCLQPPDSGPFLGMLVNRNTSSTEIHTWMT